MAAPSLSVYFGSEPRSQVGEEVFITCVSKLLLVSSIVDNSSLKAKSCLSPPTQISQVKTLLIYLSFDYKHTPSLSLSDILSAFLIFHNAPFHPLSLKSLLQLPIPSIRQVQSLFQRTVCNWAFLRRANLSSNPHTNVEVKTLLLISPNYLFKEQRVSQIENTRKYELVPLWNLKSTLDLW